jgi:DNA polymerase (family 10)
MTVSNAEIAELLDRLADLLEIEGANSFRVRAYRNAADNIGRLPESVADMVHEKRPLTIIGGVGPSLEGKIQEIVETGGLAQLAELEQHMPPQVSQLLKISGLGPRRVQVLFQELGVKNIKDLRQAVEKGQVTDLPGFGKKLEENLKKELNKKEPVSQRFRIDKAEAIVEPLLTYLRGDDISRLDVAGSYRRRRETVGDLDLLATSSAGGRVIDRFARNPGIRQVMSQGDTRSTVILSSGLQVDLRVIPAESYGAALFYFTGSRAHNIHLRTLALERGWKINEYGVFDGETMIAGETEESIYRLFGMTWVAPELREETGEIVAAMQDRLPELVRLDDLRGDLQAHTRTSDGKASLETMAKRARQLGRSYLAITDHSQSLRVAGGMSNKTLARQIDAIDRLNEQWTDFRLLKSCEVEILADGSLDVPDDLLARLDLRVCAIHSHFNLTRERQTERILAAMDHPLFNILAHPTGRLLGRRDAYEVDLERILDAARQRGCFLEINAHPERLDLSDMSIRLAKERGVKLAISTDAHAPGELSYLRYGVDQARRGWLTAADVLNTRDWPELKRLLAR